MIVLSSNGSRRRIEPIVNILFLRLFLLVARTTEMRAGTPLIWVSKEGH